MDVDLSEFYSLLSLLEGRAQLPKGKGDAALLPAQVWEPKVLAHAIRIYGVMGWDALGVPGDFEHDSADAREAIEALADYKNLLDEATHHPEVIAAAARGIDDRAQAIWAQVEGGPLERYGWNRLGLPPLYTLPEGVIEETLGPKERRNDKRLMGALAAMVLKRPGAPELSGFSGVNDLGEHLDVWSDRLGIDGLGETTVKQKIRSALKELEQSGFSGAAPKDAQT